MSLRAPPRPLDAIRTAMRILLVALALLATVLYLRQGLQLVDREQAAQSRVGKVLAFMGGDVAHRDIPKPLGSLRWWLAQPLLLVFVVTLLAGHAGFILADNAHPDLATVTRAFLPVPPHTLALSLLPVCKALGLLAVVQVGWQASDRWAQKASARIRAGVGGLADWGPRLLALALMAVVPFRLPAFALTYTSIQDRAFYDFTKKVAVLLDNSPVYFRYPGHFLQGGALKIPVLSVEVFANPYVHSERDAAVGSLEVAAAAGDVQAANRFFERYGIRYLMQDPRASRDPVIIHCAGPVVTEYAGYVLRKFEGCRR